MLYTVRPQEKSIDVKLGEMASALYETLSNSPIWKILIKVVLTIKVVVMNIVCRCFALLKIEFAIIKVSRMPCKTDLYSKFR